MYHLFSCAFISDIFQMRSLSTNFKMWWLVICARYMYLFLIYMYMDIYNDVLDIDVYTNEWNSRNGGSACSVILAFNLWHSKKSRQWRDYWALENPSPKPHPNNFSVYSIEFLLVFHIFLFCFIHFVFSHFDGFT